MSRDELLHHLISLFPTFREAWDADDNYFRDGDIYTVHGVCSQFSLFFQENVHGMNESGLRSLFDAIEKIISVDTEHKDPTANAICT